MKDWLAIVVVLGLNGAGLAQAASGPLEPMRVTVSDQSKLLVSTQRDCDLVVTLTHQGSSTVLDSPSRWITTDYVLLVPSDSPYEINFESGLNGSTCSSSAAELVAVAPDELAYYRSMMLAGESWPQGTPLALQNAVESLRQAVAVAKTEELANKARSELFWTLLKTSDTEAAESVLQQLKRSTATAEFAQLKLAWMTAQLERDKGHFENSLHWFGVAADLVPREGHPSLFVDLQSSRCDSMVMVSDPNALSCLDAVLLEPGAKVPSLRSMILNNLGGYYAERTEFDSAVGYYRDAREAAAEADDTILFVITNNNVANTLTSAGLPNEAKRLLIQSRDKLASIASGRVSTYTYLLLSQISLQLNDFDQALNYYTTTIALARAAGYRYYEAWALIGLGSVAAAQQDWDAAVHNHQLALKLLKQTYATNQRATIEGAVALSDSLLGANRAADALQELDGLSLLGELPVRMQAMIELAKAQAQLELERHDSARASASRSLQLFERTNDLKGQSGSLQLLALLDDQHDVESAIKLGAQALEKTRQARLLVENSTDFARFWSGARNQVAAQLARLRRSSSAESNFKALALIEEDRYAMAPRLQTQARRYSESNEHLRLKISSLYSQLLREDAGSSRVVPLQNRLDLLLHEFEAAREKQGPYEKIAPELISQALRPGEAYIRYYIDDTTSVAFVLQGQSVRVVDLASASDITSAVRQANTVLSTRKSDYAAALRALSELVWEPLQIGGDVNRIFVGGDGVSHYIPFPTLNYSSLGAYQPLIDRMDIQWCESWHVLLQRDTWKPQSIAVVTPFSGAGSDLARAMKSGVGLVPEKLRAGTVNWDLLPWSARETSLIESLFPPDNVVVLASNAATFDNIATYGNVLQSDVLHFATHGFVSDIYPAVSGLVLWQSGAKASDKAAAELIGWTEFQMLPTGAHLVVLNGCETGVGELVDGSGMLGLTRAFFSAGAKEVLSNQWPVADQASALMTEHFYGALRSQATTTAAALRAAQLRIASSRKFRHPFYWAGYRLFRNAKTSTSTQTSTL